MDKRKILTIILSVASLLSAFFLWLSIQRAITISDASTWAVPIALFALFVILICLDIVFFRNVLFLELTLTASFFLSLIFSPHLYQLGAVILGMFFLFLAMRDIRGELELSIKINIWKALQTGKAFLLVAFVVVISMQYFLIASQFEGKIGVPQFNLAPIVKKVALPIMATFNPALKNANSETLTVDEFFLLSQQESLKSGEQLLNDEALDSQLPQEASSLEKELMKKQIRESFSKSQEGLSQKTNGLMLEAFHRQLSDIVGHEIAGSEKISDIYAAMVTEKLNKFLSYPVNVGSEKTSAYPMILTLILVLTIYPIGSLLCFLLFMFVELVFSILIGTKIVSIKKIAVQKEMLE